MARSKKAAGMKPQELEKRVATAYDQGYFDGFVAAAEITHDIWIEISKTTKGMGPVMQKRFMDRAFEVMREKGSKKFGKPPQEATDLREALRETERIGW